MSSPGDTSNSCVSARSNAATLRVYWVYCSRSFETRRRIRRSSGGILPLRSSVRCIWSWSQTRAGSRCLSSVSSHAVWQSLMNAGVLRCRSSIPRFLNFSLSDSFPKYRLSAPSLLSLRGANAIQSYSASYSSVIPIVSVISSATASSDCCDSPGIACTQPLSTIP